jgi:hypothetical protein
MIKALWSSRDVDSHLALYSRAFLTGIENVEFSAVRPVEIDGRRAVRLRADQHAAADFQWEDAVIPMSEREVLVVHVYLFDDPTPEEQTSIVERLFASIQFADHRNAAHE